MKHLNVAVLFFVLIAIKGAAQPDTILDHDIDRWNSFTRRRPSVLFLALDKQVYNPNENILFSGYLLDTGSERAHTACHIALIDFARGKILATDQFTMTGPFSTGSLVIPDSLSSGDYVAIGYTNAMVNKDSGVFKQPITIRRAQKEPFHLANVSIFPTPGKPDSLQWHAKVITSYNGIAAGGDFQYSFRSGGRTIQAGTKKIDAFGEVDLLVPASDTIRSHIFLWASVSRNKEVCQLSTTVLLTPRRVMIRYFPESGHLVDGQAAELAISIQRANGMGVNSSGWLYEDSMAVARFQTDLYGFAILQFIPHQGKQYSTRLDHPPAESYLSGEFPDIAKTGFTLHISNAVVRDSLSLSMETTETGGSYKLLIYSTNNFIYAGSVELKKNTGRITLRHTDDWPKGLARLVLLSKDNSPAAERSIYIAPSGIIASIKVDSSVYHGRSKVQVLVRLTDTSGAPIRGVFSFTSSMAARIHPARFTDISQQMLEDQHLSDQDAVKPPAGYFTTDNALDMVLLTGMSSYLSWKGLPTDTSGNNLIKDSCDNYGYVLYKEKKPKKPLSLLLMGSPVRMLSTDSEGRYELPDSILIAPLGANPVLTVLGVSDQANYRIVIKNRYDEFARHVAASLIPSIVLKPDTAVEVIDENEGLSNGVRTLKEVVVKNGGGDEDVGIKGCPDWVCINNVLNCPNHPTGIKPLVGKEYRYAGRGAGLGPQMSITGTIVYKECMSCRGCGAPDSASFVGTVPAIHRPKEFYKVDSMRFSPDEPAIFSTLFWAPLLVTDDKGEARFYFYTNDIPGRFYNLIQGYSKVGTFRGQAVFSVTPPEKE
jgi:hypothetical protein